MSSPTPKQAPERASTGHGGGTNLMVGDNAASTPTAAPAKLGRQALTVAVGIAVPTALYYVLHGAGLSNLTALSLAAILPSLSAVYNLIVRRRVDALSLVVLATIVLTVGLSLVAHNPRFLLARDGVITGLWGLWFFVTLRARRPAAFLFAKPLMEGRKMFGTRAWNPLWEASAQFRRIWRFSTVVFGTGLLIDAVLRVVMAYSLPVPVVPALGSALWPVTFVLIQVVTNVYYHRAGLYRILGSRMLARN
jgi:intracellular septation protein A